MFITIHQIDELWMRLVLRELIAARDLFVKVPVPEQALASAVRGIDRMTEILGLIAGHFALMETMTTRDYLAFRDKLNPASGFQSAQLREIEILAGLPEGAHPARPREELHADAAQPRRLVDLGVAPGRGRLADTPTWSTRPASGCTARRSRARCPVSPTTTSGSAAFIDAYGAAHARSGRRRPGAGARRPRSTRRSGRLDERYQREIDGARAFLLAHDVADDQRPRGRASAPRWCSSRATASCRCWPGRAR
jgi:tryptophan 2,3-dioxygenase